MIRWAASSLLSTQVWGAALQKQRLRFPKSLKPIIFGHLDKEASSSGVLRLPNQLPTSAETGGGLSMSEIWEAVFQSLTLGIVLLDPGPDTQISRLEGTDGSAALGHSV